jgi:DNA polymerase
MTTKFAAAPQVAEHDRPVDDKVIDLLDAAPRAISLTSPGNDAAVGHEGDERARNSPMILTKPSWAATGNSEKHVLHHDIETRSRVELKVVGTAAYARHPSTEIMVMCYAVDDDRVEIWWPGDPVPAAFIEAAQNSNWISVAHNDHFERELAQHILVPKFGFPEIPIERRRCSMTMALAAGLPGKLEKAIDALGLPDRKDMIGHKLMLRMCKPLRDGSWLEDPDSKARLGAYCAKDVPAERGLYNALPPLIAAEQKNWELDARVNARGFAVHVPLLNASDHVVTVEEKKSQAEFRELTGLNSTNQVSAFIAWLAAHGCEVKDARKGTLRFALRRKAPGKALAPNVRRAIELRLQLAHASATKIKALLAWRCPDDRVRGTLIFHGTSTGRWAGRGPQPQNFKRDSDGIEAKIAGIMAGGAGLSSPIEAVGDIARGTIIAAPGHRLLIGDFSGVESRVLAYIAGETSKLEQWAQFDRTGLLEDDPYYRIGIACGLPKDLAREFGKIIDLAFGFQGGLGAWKNLAPDDDQSTDEDIKRYQRHFRRRHPHTVAFWIHIDAYAIKAVRNRGQVFDYRGLRLLCDESFLRITLPGGRPLSYPFPRIFRDKYGYARVMFKDASMGKWGDCRFGQGAYGGLWAENLTQAVARDLLAEAMQRLEAAGYPIVLTVHDEVICEVPDGHGSVEEFRALLTAAPAWASGPLPIAAKVREAQRWGKSAEATNGALVDPIASIADIIGGDIEHELDELDELDEPNDKAKPADPGSNDDELAALLAAATEPDEVGAAAVHLSAAAPHSEIGGDAAELGEPDDDAAPDSDDHDGGGNSGRGGNGVGRGGNGRDHDTGGYPHGEQRGGRQVATYLYLDHRGHNHTEVKKLAATATRRAQYPQQFWDGERWVKQKPAGWLKVPYRLPELLEAIAAGRVVHIPEGEKDCDTLVELGLIVTTNSEGATPLKAKVSKWTPELNKWFHGVQCVYIHADNDDVGRKFAREKARALQGIAPRIYIVSYPDVPEGEDVSHWIKELGHSKADLIARCKAAPKWQGDATGELECVRASDVDLRAIDWLWPNRFAIGKIGVIAGLPDEGKGQILCYITARLTRELQWPIGEGMAPRGNVIILSAEEDPHDSLAPRLAAAGADLELVHFVKMVLDHGDNGEPHKRMFSLVTDLEKLRKKILEVGDVRAVLIDPITAYLGVQVVDSFRDTDVRAVLGPLKELAEEMRVAVITVMHFNKKVDITNALLRISNSLAFVGLPRHVYGVVADAENERTLLVRCKNNDAPKSDNQTLAFHFDVKEVGYDAKLAKAIRAPFIVWEDEYVDVTATEAMQAASENKSASERKEAKTLLLALLADGREVLVDEIRSVAKGNGCAWRTIERAKKDLHVEADRVDRTDPKSKWFWKLPPQD